MKNSKSRFFAQIKDDGFTTLSALVGAVIVIVGALAIGTLSHYMLLQQVKSSTMSGALALQTEILAGLQRSSTFEGIDQLAQMKAQIESGGSGTSNIDGIVVKNSRDQIVAVSGYRIGLDLSLNACDPVDPNCKLRSDLAITCDSSAGCQAAYRVSISNAMSIIGTAPLGAPLHAPVASPTPTQRTGVGRVNPHHFKISPLLVMGLGATAHAAGNSPSSAPYIGRKLQELGDPSALFQLSDFTAPVSFDFTSRNQPSVCGESQDLLVTGITTLSGKASCIKKNVQPCQQGQVAESLRAVAPSTGGFNLEYTCRDLAPASCPTDYVWQSLNLATTDSANPGAGGVCVYRYKDNIPWQQPWPPNSESVSGTFCNPNVYVASSGSSCSPVVTSSSPGTCWDSCPPCSTDLYGNVSCSSCPRRYDPYATVVQSGGNGSDANASCTIQYHNDCGSSIAGYVQWGGVCLLRPSIPRTINR